jgi:hypothetical protein
VNGLRLAKKKFLQARFFPFGFSGFALAGFRVSK